jgi:hypothetical protein
MMFPEFVSPNRDMSKEEQIAAERAGYYSPAHYATAVRGGTKMSRTLDNSEAWRFPDCKPLKHFMEMYTIDDGPSPESIVKSVYDA